MARQNKINMPSSGGGLTSFYGESASKIRFSPEAVVLAIIVCIGIILFITFLLG